MSNAINLNEKYILAGYGFDNITPYLLLDSFFNGKSKRLKFSFQDQLFSLIRFKGRYCIGRYDLKTFDSSPCPEKAALSEKNNTCINCFRAIGFNPAFYNRSSEELSPQQKEYNEQPHNVYLAYFGLKTIKVGIAHYKRTLTRWCEQGARAATVIKKCYNAYEARDMESIVERKLNLPDAINSNTKRKFLNEPFNFHNAVIELRQICNRIEAELNIEIEQTEISDLQKYYLGEHSLGSGIVDVSKEKPLYISGKGIGMIGDMLIVEQVNRQFMASIKLFISHLVQITDEMKEYSVVPIQMAFL